MPGFKLTHVTSEDAIHPNGPILKDQLDLLRIELGDAQYDQECLLIPIPDIDVFFGLDLVKSCFADKIPRPKTDPIIIGFDHAVSSRDESIAYVTGLIGEIQTEIETRSWQNTLVHDQAEELKKLYPEALYCIDATAEGGKEALGTFQRAGLSVLGIDFSKTKPTLMITLKNSMQQHVFFFNDEKLQNQLGYYKFQQSETQKGKFRYGKPGIPDDRVDAAALAAYRAFLMRGYGGESNVAFVGGDDLRPSETSQPESGTAFP
jgi:hypothetical protein